MTFVEDISESDNRETKRRRLEVKQNRPPAFELEPDPSEGVKTSLPAEPEVDNRTLMEIASELAPRVGTKIIEHGPFFEKVQSIFKSRQIRVIELCKGADRCRKPPIRLAPHEAPLRATIGIHRVTKATFMKDWENWEVLRGRSLTEKTQPARLLVTIFGSPVNRETQNRSEKRAHDDSTEEDISKRPRVGNELKIPEPKDDSSAEKASKQNAIEREPDSMYQRHGPKFLQLTAEDRQWLQKIHINLGHPHADRLRKTLQLQSCPKHILDAIDDFRCSTCHELQKPRLPRPAAISDVTEFNQCVGCDLVTWSTKEGKIHTFFHVVDMATSFQLAQPVYQTSHEALQDALSRTWIHWAGSSPRASH